MKRCPQCPEVYSDMMHFCPNDGRQLVPIVAQDPLIGTTIDGKYLIEAVIGRGGMGVVYRAKHTNFNRLFAIKILKSELVNDPQAVKRFRNEANAAGAIRHPNAIAITDFNITADGLAYLVMDYVEGRSLREILKKEGALPFTRTVNLITQVCDAVGAAHRKGIIHRDLKPDNIMVEKTEGFDEEMVHVLDFGIAKLSQNPAYSENITVGGAILGSPYYMSPEQCDGRQLDPRSDIYSVGIILYEMLTGKVPFRAQTPWGLVKMHCSTLPQPVRVHRPDVLPRLEDAVLRALAKDPNDRQQSALDLHRELEAALDENQPVRSAFQQAPEKVQVAWPKASKNAPTAPIDQAAMQVINEPAEGLPSGAKSGPLLTTPMEALANQENLVVDAPYAGRLSAEAQAAEDAASEERRKLEELARELEAEISQLKARKESSGGFKVKKYEPRSEPLQNMAQEISQELEHFEPKREEDLRQALDNGGRITQPTPGRALPSRPLKYKEPTTSLPPQQELTGEVGDDTYLDSQDVVQQTVEPFDLAEEFSLALPEMVEDVMMSVSETISMKAEVLSRRAAEEAIKADAQASAAAGRLPGSTLSAKQNKRSASGKAGQKSRPELSLQPDLSDRSLRPPPPRGMIEMEVKSDTEFKKKLIKIAAGSLGLIVIILAYIYFTREPETRPPGPGRRPGSATRPVPTANNSEPGVKRLPDGTVVAPEGMAYLAGGSFLMGRKSDDPCEGPEHEATVSPFFIDKYEVTNRRYADFIQSTGHASPQHWQRGGYPSGEGDYPVTGVSWQDAVDYCEWRTRQTGTKFRLPTETEWEYAARGNDSNPFPWGQKWQPNAANYKDTQRKGPVSVGSFRSGETPTGISDMIGNVAEWTASDAVAYPNSTCKIPTGTLKTVRGGHFNSSKDKASVTYRDWLPPSGNDYSTVGFRCVREIQ